jgi:hypothetical protein
MRVSVFLQHGHAPASIRLASPATRCAPAFSRRPPEHGASVWKMMDVSRHKSVNTLRGYVRNAESFKDHAGAAFL